MKFLKNIFKRFNWIKERLKINSVLILPPLFYLILSFTRLMDYIAFVPDYLCLMSQNSQDYYGLIIGSIASILGILMAVVLLSVEFLQERLPKPKSSNSLSNPLVRNSIFNSVSLISVSFLAYIQTSNFDNPTNLTLGYLIGLMFLVYIYSIYPVVKSIVGRSSRIRENIDLITQLSLSSFKSVGRPIYQQDVVDDGRLNDLKQEIDTYILENKVTSYEKMYSDVLTRSLSLISDGSDREICDVITDGLTWLWRGNLKTAVRANDSNLFELIWDQIKELYVHFAENKSPLLHLQNIELFISLEFLQLHFSNEDAMPLKKAFECIEVAIDRNLQKNCPNQDKLSHLSQMYDKNFEIEYSQQDEMQWDHVCSIFWYIDKIQKSAIDIGDKDTFEWISMRISWMCQSILRSDYTIGTYQKGYLIWHMLSSSFYNSTEALEKGMYQSSLNCFHIPRHLIKDIIERGQLENRDVRVILQNLTRSMLQAFKLNKLHIDSYFGTLYDFYIIGIHCIKLYRTNKFARHIVEYIIEFLVYLKNDIEKTHPHLKAKEYNQLKENIRHFVNVAIRYDGFKVTEAPVSNWVEIVDSFKKTIKSKDTSVVKWKSKKIKKRLKDAKA